MWMRRNQIVRKLTLGVVTTVLGMSLSFSALSATPVETHGQLSIENGRLVDEQGKRVQLRGVSSHGLQWFGDYVNKDSMKWLRDDWGINVFRVAMYTAADGYISNPSLANKVKEAVAAAQSLGVYIIIDWHILSDNDPNIYKAQAKTFFAEMAGLYGSSPNVIYEIANEPNGGVTWNGQIRPYALEVTDTIRSKDPDNLIIVGTGTWSQDIHDAADNQLPDPNTMYALHFYAGTHGQFLRDRIDYAQSRGAAIFVSEWGTSDASGNGGPFLPESQTWIDFLNNRGVSWVNWSLTDKSEASAALAPGASKSGGWTEQNLSTSGKFVREQIRAGADLSNGDNGGDTPTPPTEPTNPGNGTTGDVVLQYRNVDNNPSDDAIRMAVNIKNTGSTPIKLSDLQVRYYFHDDGKPGANLFVDWANVGPHNIVTSTGTPAASTDKANRYVLVTFSSGAGSLQPGAETGEVQVRIHAGDWSNVNETNDYSYGANVTSYANWDKITVHDKGTLVWGTEP
ncbi:cellulase family glycosylhydrolase [Pectobacterium parvum]|uniref:cellulase family glycosylhydrolase n=1 Tax=Pectobacterium parvum TaxID=2778550 RepID=UPI003827DDB4